MSQLITDNVQIIQVLCQAAPAAVTVGGILAALQSRHPEVGWTQELLQERLTDGVRQGLYLPVGGNPAGPVEGYSIQKNALKLNYPQNKIYECFCSQFLPLAVRRGRN